MNVDVLWNSFTNEISEILVFRRAILNVVKRERQTLEKRSEGFRERSDLLKYSSDLNNFPYINVLTGKREVYAQTEKDLEQQAKLITLHQNKQYQWLFVDVYEVFESYVCKLYGYLGYRDPESWPLKDFGNIKLPELKTKNFAWFESQAKRKGDRPNGVLNAFRQVFPELSKIEAKNALDVNLILTIQFAQLIRHQIVHGGGVVPHREKFIRTVLEKAGLFNNGHPSPMHLKFFDNYFGEAEYANLISLLEVPLKTDSPVSWHINVFENTTGYLVSYSDLISELVKKHVGENSA